MVDTIRGVSVAQYAGVVAAVADDIELAEALSDERIDPAAWSMVDAAWKAAIAEDGMDGPLFKSFADRRAEAEDCLARPVRPIDEDLAAWMRFLADYAGHPAPFDMLAGAGMRLADLSRLSRRWARRFAEDRDLEKRAAEIKKRPPSPASPITVGEATRKPFPWSKGPSAAPAVAAEVELAPAPAIDLPLDRYAAIVVELADPKADRPAVLARYGIDADRFAALDAAWKARLAADAEAARDYRQLHAYQRSRLAAAAKVAPRDPNAPPPALTGTALSLDRPLVMVLPFIEGEAPQEIADPPPAPNPRPAAGLAGTALALDIPRGPELPFGTDPRAEAPSPKPNLVGTAPMLDAPPLLALPFVEGEAPDEIADPTSEPKPPQPGSGTALALDIPRGPALPFAPDPPHPVPPAKAPVMTIEQYASLCVELEGSPEAEVLARYHLTAGDRAALDEAFSKRFRQAPAQRRTWERACDTYRTWLAAQGSKA